MASTAIAENLEGTTVEAEKTVLDRFIRLRKQNSDSSTENSPFEFEDWETAGFDYPPSDVIGIDCGKGVVRLPRPMSKSEVRKMRSSTSIIVEWEGVVDHVEGDDRFHSRLRAIKGSNTNFEEFTTLNFDWVPAGDRELVQPGALFRLVIGFQAINGTKEKFARVVFRRLPAWNQNAIIQAQSEIESDFQAIQWQDEVTT